MVDIVQTPAALYTLYRYERLFISLAKPSLLNLDASAFKPQSHQIALSTSESSPNCMESILVLDASQNFKICISSPSLDIKSFFVLNLLYRPFCVNLLLFIYINIIFIANCCILFWYIRPITQFADSTKDFISCPYAKRTKRPSLERPSCVLHTCLQSFLPVPAELRQRQVGVFLLRPADAPLIVEDEQVVSPEVLHPLRV